MYHATVLLACPQRTLREELSAEIALSECELLICETAGEVTHSAGQAQVVVLGSSPGSPLDVMLLAQTLCAGDANLAVIIVVAESAEDLAVAASRVGVRDYFRSPMIVGELAQAVRRLLDKPAARKVPVHSQRLIGSSTLIQRTKAAILDIAAADSNVLITGETGTGKELVAEMIHQNSARSKEPFRCINCAAIPDSLLESELFGYEKGAFTGATSAKQGALEATNGGTVFLDEIGEMSALAQAKVLRAIETRKVHRLGGNSPISLQIRIVAATNRDLESLVRQDLFRNDLFFRLSVVRIHLPPLRERPEDVSALLDHFLFELNAKFDRQVIGVTPETKRYLQSYAWPGNVRELRNMLEATFVHLPFARMRFLEIPEPYRKQLAASQQRPVGTQVDEQQRLYSVLEASGGNKSKAARELHWSRTTLYRKMASHRNV